MLDDEEKNPSPKVEENVTVKFKKFNCYICQTGFHEEEELTEHEKTHVVLVPNHQDDKEEVKVEPGNDQIEVQQVKHEGYTMKN